MSRVKKCEACRALPRIEGAPTWGLRGSQAISWRVVCLTKSCSEQPTTEWRRTWEEAVESWNRAN